MAPQVLKKIVTVTKASIISVYCQFGKAKSGLVILMATSIMVVTMKTLEVLLASQPNVDIQPARS